MTTTQTTTPAAKTISDLPSYVDDPKVIAARDQDAAAIKQSQELSDRLELKLSEIQEIDENWQDPNLESRVRLTIEVEGLKKALENCNLAIEEHKKSLRQIEFEAVERLRPIANEIAGAIFAEELAAFEQVAECRRRLDQLLHRCGTTGVGSAWFGEQHRDCKPAVPDLLRGSGINLESRIAEAKAICIKNAWIS